MTTPRFLRRLQLRRSSCATVVAAALLIVAGWAITLERIAYEREETERSAFRETSNLALAFEQDVIRTLEGLEQALRFAEREYLQGGPQVDLRPSFGTSAIDHGPLMAVAIVDERGIVIVSTRQAGQDLSDRDYFRFHATHPSSELVIGKPVTGRIGGRPTIPVSRRIDKMDGQFGGMVLAGVAPSYFTDFFQRTDVGAHGVIQILGTDGIVRARRVGESTSGGGDLSESALLKRAASASSGSFLTAGRVDGTRRYMSYRKVERFPLLVSVGVSMEEAMAPFAARERSYYVGAAFATLLVVFFAAALIRVTGRHALALAEKRRADAIYRATFDHAPVGIAYHALDGRFLNVNQAFTRMLGYSQDELRRRTFLDILHPEDAAAARKNLGAARPARLKVENRHIRKDGSEMWAAVAVSFVADAAGAPEYFVAMVEDITERKRAERALASSRKRFRDLVDNTSDFIWELDAQMRFTYASESLRKLLGYDPAEVIGKATVDLMPAADREAARAKVEAIAASRQGFAGLEHQIFDVHGKRHVWEASGVPIFDAEGTLKGYRGVSRDITARKAAEKQLRHDAHYDRMTGLPNRTLCFDRLEQAITQARRNHEHTVLMLLDMDRFKNINDTLGPAAGDAVLRAIAGRLGACVRAGDTVARVGGDEFAIVLQRLQRPQDARVVAEKILAALAAPVRQEAGQEIFATLSIGIAVCPPDGERPEVLMRNADAALFQAKKAGRNLFQFYAAEMNAKVADQIAFEADLRRALERDEFTLHYQPKVHLADGHVAGFEALLRWSRAGHGPVSPAQFVPVLEESGLIREVGAWVLREACRQVRAWIDEGCRPLPVAVNISAKQFHGDLPALVERALREFRVAPEMLEVEITESDAMLDPDRAMAALHRLRAIGVEWSIDDFGTGYSSLSYLKRFQPGQLKLDRSFVKGLPHDADDASITKAVIGMAHNLGMEVVAEGVETEAQRHFLQRHGCDEMQGYLFSKPLPAAQCRAFLLPAAAEIAA